MAKIAKTKSKRPTPKPSTKISSSQAPQPWHKLPFSKPAALLVAFALVLVGSVSFNAMAANAPIVGPDTSNWQPYLNTSSAYTQGYRFQIMKATEGLTFQDSRFGTSLADAKIGKLIPGAYHFLHRGSGSAQADYFINTVKAHNAGGTKGVAYMLDVESYGSSYPLYSDVTAFVARFKQLVPNRTLIIYTGTWFWGSAHQAGYLHNPKAPSGTVLDVSIYINCTGSAWNVLKCVTPQGAAGEPYAASPINGWPSYFFRQYSSTAGFANIVTDANVTYRGLTSLKSLTGVTAPTPTPKTPTPTPKTPTPTPKPTPKPTATPSKTPTPKPSPAPGVPSASSHLLTVFTHGNNNHLYYKWYQNATAGWSNWQDLGGNLASSPASVSWAPGRLDVFAKGVNNDLQHKWLSGGKWSNWESLGGKFSSAPVVTSWGTSRLDVFVKGDDNALYHKWFNGGWSAWENLGGDFASGPGAASWSSGRLDVFVRGNDNALYSKFYANGKWSVWNNLGGLITNAPTVESWSAGRLDVFVRGTDQALYHMTYTTSNGWSKWENLGGQFASAPTVASWVNGRFDVFVIGNDKRVYRRTYQNGWSANWDDLGGSFLNAPGAAAWN